VPQTAYGAHARQLKRFLAVLARAPDGLSLAQLRARCAISRPTVYRLIALAAVFEVRIEAQGARGHLRYGLVEAGCFDLARLARSR